MRDLITDEYTNNECTICGTGSENVLKGIRKLALVKLDTCAHKFCFDCIFEWSDRSCNQCPLCRKDYFSVSRLANPLQAAQKVYITETVYISIKR